MVEGEYDGDTRTTEGAERGTLEPHTSQRWGESWIFGL